MTSPNVLLDTVRDIIERLDSFDGGGSGLVDELYDAFKELDEELTRGGELPRDWEKRHD